MTTRNLNKTIGCAAIFALMTQIAPAGHFTFRIDNAGTNDGSPTDDAQNFQQVWGSPTNWTLESGEDDGANGYPDATDTVTIDRTPGPVNNSTRLTTENSPGGLISIAGITGTGTGNQDIVFKLRDFTIGDLTLEASPTPFTIREERDRSLTINGVISGPGSLLLHRDGGFIGDNIVEPGDLITITGTSPNTITGTVRLFNGNNDSIAGNNKAPKDSYWVADKVGAFGQASTLTLEGRAGDGGGIASLQITANAVGGEGAIDDDATTVYIGAKGVLSIDADVNEGIGEGMLFIDLAGTGTYTEVAAGIYNNSEEWIIGEGAVTVGAVSPLPFAITDIIYDPDADTVKLTWRKTAADIYGVYYSRDLINWGTDLDDNISAAKDENPGDADSITMTFDLVVAGLAAEEDLFFRVQEE